MTAIRGVLFDLAGVLHQGEECLPGAREAVVRVRDAGLKVRFVTNTSRQTRAMLLERLLAMGFDIRREEIFTAPLAARAYMEKRGCRPYLLIHPALREDFAEVDTQRPDSVLVGDAGSDFTYDNLNPAFRLLMEGAPLIAIGTNRYFREASGLSLDAGAFVRALEYAAGTSAVVVGKPAPEFFLAAVGDMGLEPAEVVMIGDDVAADVRGAHAAGLPAILVRTGKYRSGDEDQLPESRCRVAGDVSEAVALISSANPDAPF